MAEEDGHVAGYEGPDFLQAYDVAQVFFLLLRVCPDVADNNAFFPVLLRQRAGRDEPVVVVYRPDEIPHPCGKARGELVLTERGEFVGVDGRADRLLENGSPVFAVGEAGRGVGPVLLGALAGVVQFNEGLGEVGLDVRREVAVVVVNGLDLLHRLQLLHFRGVPVDGEEVPVGPDVLLGDLADFVGLVHDGDLGGEDDGQDEAQAHQDHSLLNQVVLHERREDIVAGRRLPDQ
ncbi:MAG: hypothetical protein CSYNP_04511 [Syntrophus sp. SKADARSKE-3]|nr:hypothetical protein [Syntrophus sp. SKADARSKE-3]